MWQRDQVVRLFEHGPVLALAHAHAPHHSGLPSLPEGAVVVAQLAGDTARQQIEDGSKVLTVTYAGDDAMPVAWIATHTWAGVQTIEGFTDPDFRRRGIANIEGDPLKV